MCDVDEQILANRAAELEGITGRKPKTYVDLRELLGDKSIDAVTFGTPNHWHVLGAIWALQHGKDVYLEKPISHTVWEGRQLVAAVKKYGRVLQHGTQRRSEPVYRRQVERARSGVIGDIYMARCPIFRFRDAFSFPGEEEPPANLHWTLWQGPAPEQPFSRNYVHYTWHWFWHYGNGEIGNNGPHATDIANWVMDKGLPVKTSAEGGIFGYEEDARQTPNTQAVTHTFADGSMMTIEIRNRYTNSEGGNLILFGTEGHMYGGKFFDKNGKEIPDDQTPPAVDSTKEHMTNFLEAVKNADPTAVNATAEQGHIAAALCHLGNIAYRVGHTITFDPKTERIAGDDEADALLTRSYREGFEVPRLA
ncbi:MAG TPA: Gfo/Idh/MocA family oxidoreductase [Candidatus Hydrogenedentes bacterium]|nr:Gfo/Idh/MocA family oxidoreductase [Candidatus Hydrogenedentota bacterium]